MSERTEAATDELQSHMARYNTQYDGKGGIAHEDHGGIWCGCGWDSGPVQGIRPWRDYHRHVVEAVLAQAQVTQGDTLLRDALRLLRSARCELADPGIRRSWGQRRRRWMDAVLDRVGEVAD